MVAVNPWPIELFKFPSNSNKNSLKIYEFAYFNWGRKNGSFDLKKNLSGKFSLCSNQIHKYYTWKFNLHKLPNLFTIQSVSIEFYAHRKFMLPSFLSSEQQSILESCWFGKPRYKNVFEVKVDRIQNFFCFLSSNLF